MAYMTKEHCKEIRENLKKQFPNFKFSVRNSDYTGVDVAIMAGDVDFSDIMDGREHRQLNHYYLSEHYNDHGPLLQQIFDVINKGNYDKSDAMTDYFDVGFYVHFTIGQWDKPYVYKKG